MLRKNSVTNSKVKKRASVAKVGPRRKTKTADSLKADIKPKKTSGLIRHKKAAMPEHKLGRKKVLVKKRIRAGIPEIKETGVTVEQKEESLNLIEPLVKPKEVKVDRPAETAIRHEKRIEESPVVRSGPSVKTAELNKQHLPSVEAPALDAVKAAGPEGAEFRTIGLRLPVTLKDLAASMQEKPAAIIKKLLDHKIIANLNYPVEEELAERIALGYGYKIKRKPTEDELLFEEHQTRDPSRLKPRPPIVTFMGHVDHGKTSLLDAIRKSKVADSEYGGITQHIGAYSVSLPKGRITFLDTPGHEAFTAMRARGAKITDIVVLVVAADDGLMPQTVEAIDHARDAKVPIIVAINKIDKPQLNLDKVKKQLAELDLNPEEWGGRTITVGVSAKTGEGINQLLEMILLESEMLELTADSQKSAKGAVLEAKITEGRGPVATLLVEDGTLHPHDVIIVGPFCAKIRAMYNEYGKKIKEASPSSPVEVLGLSGLPESGEKFFVLTDEKKAKELAARRRDALREKALRPARMMSLEDLSGAIKEGKVKELKLILKADVGGSIEAIDESLRKLDTQEIRLTIIHKGAGSINVSDVILAQASQAIIVGFHVTCDDRSREEADKSGVDIRTYNVIYELINDLKTALEGMLEPKLKKKFLGRILVKQVFKVTKAGMIAGSYVEKGKVTRSAKASLLRNGEIVYEGAIQSLKRFKDDAREATEGMECGISLAGFSDILAGDVIEVYEVEMIARKL